MHFSLKTHAHRKLIFGREYNVSASTGAVYGFASPRGILFPKSMNNFSNKTSYGLDNNLFFSDYMFVSYMDHNDNKT